MYHHAVDAIVEGDVVIELEDSLVVKEEGDM